ncbi:MAG: TlpA disulfide reductase family protein [Halioglobus sp.]
MRPIVILALALLLGACGQTSDSTPQPSISDYPGQWLVVNYWAKWCGPCIKEIPELNRLGQEHSHITVLGVNYDGVTGDDLSLQTDVLGVEFPTLAVDPASHFKIARPRVLPTTLIITPEGELKATLVGPQTAESLLIAIGNIAQ